MKIILALLCCFAAQSTWAQQRKLTDKEALPGKITVTQTAMFDTVAAYVEGKVLSYQTHRPIAGASINIVYDGGSAVGTAISAKNGKFRVGWVSVGKDRSVRVAVKEFQPLVKREVGIKDGHSNFLLVELLPVIH